MATRYVSNTTSNGYTTGSDSNTAAQATSQSTPWLTLTKAFSASSAGDTIVINQGTYLEAANISPTVANLTINPDPNNTNPTIVQTATAGNTRVIILNTAAGNITFGAITLDGQNVQATCASSAGGSFPPSVTFHGTIFINFTTNAVSINDCGLFTMDQNWTATGPNTVNSGAVIFCGPSSGNGAKSKYVITNGTINMGTCAATTSYGVRCSVQSGDYTNFTATGLTVTGTTSGNGKTIIGISVNTGAVNSIISNNTVTFSSAGTSSTLHAINITGAGFNCRTQVNNNTCNVTVSDNASVGAGIYGGVSGLRGDVYIYSNTVTIASSTASLASGSLGIVMFNASSGLINSLLVQNNTVTLPIPTTGAGGVSIQLGDNSTPTQSNSFRTVLCAGNVVNGGNHGILMGNINNYTCIGNQIVNTELACVDKENNHGSTNLPGIWYKNRISRLDGANVALYCKGSVNTIYDSNWVDLDPIGATSYFINCAQDPVGSVPSTGCVYRNNVCYGSSNARPTALVNVDSVSDCTFSNNTYYSTGGFASNPFNYQGTTYANLLAWAAARESNAVGTDPTLRAKVSRTGVTR